MDAQDSFTTFDDQCNFDCTKAQKRRWTKAAHQKQLKLAQWIRLAADAAADAELQEKPPKK